MLNIATKPSGSTGNKKIAKKLLGACFIITGFPRNLAPFPRKLYCLNATLLSISDLAFPSTVGDTALDRKRSFGNPPGVQEIVWMIFKLQ
jgi:hypothetical protein